MCAFSQPDQERLSLEFDSPCVHKNAADVAHSAWPGRASSKEGDLGKLPIGKVCVVRCKTMLFFAKNKTMVIKNATRQHECRGRNSQALATCLGSHSRARLCSSACSLACSSSHARRKLGSDNIFCAFVSLLSVIAFSVVLQNVPCVGAIPDVTSQT